MGTSTFSGPIRAGTVRTGGATSMNCGVVELCQTATLAFGTILASPAAVNLFTLPAGAKINDFLIEVTTALVTATNCGIVIGKSGTANFFMTTLNTGTSAVRVPPTTVAAALVVAECNNIGTADITLTATPTAATADATAGSIIVTVRYLQRSAAGSAAAVA